MQAVTWIERGMRHGIAGLARPALAAILLSAVAFFFPQVLAAARGHPVSFRSPMGDRAARRVADCQTGRVRAVGRIWLCGGLFGSSLFLGCLFGAAFVQIASVSMPSLAGARRVAFMLRAWALSPQRSSARRLRWCFLRWRQPAISTSASRSGRSDGVLDDCPSVVRLFLRDVALSSAWSRHPGRPRRWLDRRSERRAPHAFKSARCRGRHAATRVARPIPSGPPAVFASTTPPAIRR